MTKNREYTTPESDRKRELRGILCAFLGAACWGFSATCVSFLVDRNQVDVLWLACTRLFVAGTLFCIIAFVRDRGKLARLVSDRRMIRDLIAYTAVGVVLMQISYMSGIKYTNAGTTLLLMELGVPFVLLVECVRDRRSPRVVEVAAMVLAAAGVVSIATQGNLGSIGINPIGLFWGLATAVATAGYNLIPVRLIRECGSTALNGVSMLLASIVLVPFAHPFEVPAGMDSTGWLVFGAIVAVGTMLAYAVYLRGVADAGPTKASLFGVFEPISGATFSALWLGTVFSMWDFIGGAFIIAMMLLVALKGTGR